MNQRRLGQQSDLQFLRLNKHATPLDDIERRFVDRMFGVAPACVRSSMVLFLALTLVVWCAALATGQQTAVQGEAAPTMSAQNAPVDAFSPGPVDLESLPKNLFLDQK